MLNFDSPPHFLCDFSRKMFSCYILFPSFQNNYNFRIDKTKKFGVKEIKLNNIQRQTDGRNARESRIRFEIKAVPGLSQKV